MRVELRITLGILSAAVAAYSLSFAVDILFGTWLGTYPDISNNYVPVTVWSLVSLGFLLTAIKLIPIPRRRWLALTYVVFGALALMGALISHHLLNLAVAAMLFIQAFMIWRSVS